MKTKVLFAIAIVAAILVGHVLPSLAQVGRRSNQDEPPELTALNDKSVKELVAVLSQPEKQIRVPDNTAAQSHTVSMWDRASRLLASKLEQARPMLVEMLDSETAATRANAIKVLLADNAKNLNDLRPRLIKLLSDSSRAVRIACARILPKIKNEGVENELLEALSRAHSERPRSGECDSEIRTIVSALCHGPLQKEKVVEALLDVLDESNSSRTVVWTTIQASTNLSRSEQFGNDLLERYWQILKTTNDDSLPYIVTGAMLDNDERTLDYLRKVESITNPQARGYAAAELLSHSGFDPEQETELFESLLHDQSPWVRNNVIASLCVRGNGVSPKFQISIALMLCDEDADNGVKVRAIVGVFDVLRRTQKEARAKLIADPELMLATKMIEALEHESLLAVVVYQTGQLAGQTWRADQGEAAIKKARNWWRQQMDD